MREVARAAGLPQNQGRGEANGKVLAACWAVLAITIVVTGSNSTGTRTLHLEGMIGPSYMLNVFLCLLVSELLRDVRRWMAVA